MSRRLALVVALLGLAGASPASAQLRASPFDAYASAPATGGPRAGVPAGLVATSVDARRGVPVFLMGRRALDRADLVLPRARARHHLAALAPLWGVAPSQVPGLAQHASTHATPSGGALVIFGERVDGVPVFETRVSLLLDARGALIAAGGQLRPRGHGAPRFARTHLGAVRVALADAFGSEVGGPSPVAFATTGPDGFQRWVLGPNGRARGWALDRPVRIRRVLYPLPDRLVPAHYAEVWAHDVLVAYVVSAEDGTILMRRPLTVDDRFDYTVYADPAHPLAQPHDSPFGDTSPDPFGMPVSNLLPYVEASTIPIEGFNRNPLRAADPWLPAGATTTAGNNVDAYADLVRPDGFQDGDRRAGVTSAGAFGHRFDPTTDPNGDENVQAAVTHLFYVNNWLHDWFYDLGFDEAAGNAQADNFGRGGEGEDVLVTQANDYSRRNNANMSTPQDGSSPRMQMFLWSGRETRSLTVDGATYPVDVASFGPRGFDATGPLTLVDDGTGTATDACEDTAQDLSGQIALIDRGDCTFIAKIRRAEAAGALGVIIMDNRPGGPSGMGGDGEPPTIGSFMVSQSDGATLRAMEGTDAAMLRDISQDVPSALDTQVVAHEWGHYIHNRLTSCGSALCGAQGEGWGDFLALLILMEEGDDLDAPYPSAAYSNQGRRPIFFGTRRIAYSANRAFDALTYRMITDGEALPTSTPFDDTTLPNSEVHNAGEIWATMMFDALVAMIRRSREPGAPYSFEEARERLGRYIVVGMQLAPRAPTFTEQRDGLVAAALETDLEDARLIAEAFAGRGLGTCAGSPDRFSTDFAGAVEHYEVGPRPVIRELELVFDGARRLCDDDGLLDGGETAWVRAVIENDGVVDLVGATMRIEASDDGIAPTGLPIRVIGDLAPGDEAEVFVEIAADEATVFGGPTNLTATVGADALCGEVSRTLRIVTDRDAGMSLFEDFEVDPPWLVESSLGFDASAVWSVGPSVLGDPDWVLRGLDSPTLSDTAIELPEMTVLDGIPFVVRFEHRYDFEAEFDDGEVTWWDGGVIELSLDGGMTWQDVADHGVSPAYDGVLTDRAMNPLSDRRAFSGQNPSLPDEDTVRLDFGTSLAGEQVRLRFRIGADQARGRPGWEIDDLTITGVDPPPFPSFLSDETSCDGAPVADAGEDLEVAAGDAAVLDGSGSSDPDGDPLSYEWRLLAETPAVTLAEPTEVTTTFGTPPSAAARRTWTVRLTVRDPSGASASDEVNVTVVPASLEAVPDAGPSDVDGGGAPPDGAVDGGPMGGIGGGGCSCRAAPGPRAPLGLGAVALIGLLGRRRRR